MIGIFILKNLVKEEGNLKNEAKKQKIETRIQLYNFLQDQMSYTYAEVKDEKKLSYESTLVKSYIFEVDLPRSAKEATNKQSAIKEFIEKNFRFQKKSDFKFSIFEKEEEGFFEIQLPEVNFYVDTITNERFWMGFSVSGSKKIDKWFETVVRSNSALDSLWLWPSFLEETQKLGEPRGFGLDYDFRRFEDNDDTTTYLKMQLWGGADTEGVYDLLKTSPMRNKIVLSKVRMKTFGDVEKRDEFALQEVKYTGKFTTKGTNFSVHASTLNNVRNKYAGKIVSIENEYALKWTERGLGKIGLEGYALHFIPNDFEIPVEKFCAKVFDGTIPFRLLGITTMLNKHGAVADVVDLHTGGELSFEVYPDIITVYLPENTCGNSIARLFTNLQHYFNVGFRVEADNGDRVF